MLARIAIIVPLASALALAGCGRRGPLEPPPGVPDQKPVQKQEAPRASGSTAPDGLFRNTSNQDKDPASVTAPERKARASGSFVLDPLLQ
ncbi:MAG: lipoprotein [Hyphomicrobiales bacterium]|nr:lipoprotein [Hyphomicrobiales bacterium]